MDAVARLIEIAKAEIGYLEKASNAYLDDKLKNAGDRNWTKYARDLDNIHYFNGPKNGYQWCTSFVHWCFYKAFGEYTAYKLTCCSKGSSAAGCVYAVDYYKAKGQYHKTNPKPGDQIFFEYDGEPGHTGIVAEVTGDRVYTIEGNTSGASDLVWNGGGVCMKSYPLNYYRICGYGRPDYSIVDPNYEPKEEKPIEQKKEVEGKVTVETRLVVKGMTGEDVRAMQILLIGRGYSCGICGADGDYGSATESAVKKFQNAKGLNADAECGPLTWGKLVNG